MFGFQVAERVAEERCEPCGGEDSSVGYQIRLEAYVLFRFIWFTIMIRKPAIVLFY